MSHEIETMFSVREKPWHFAETKEVTKLIQEAPTSAEALRLAGLNWRVEPKPIYTEDDGIFGKTMTPIPGFVANTRDSDGAVQQQLTKMQIEIPNFNKEIDALQARIGKYNNEINMYISEINELRKDMSALQTSINRLQDQKKKLEGVISDLIGCSKRLMNMK